MTGTREGEVAAARAYDDGARRLFGKFAVFNFPRDGERSAAASLLAIERKIVWR
jgi:hypothetical protein